MALLLNRSSSWQAFFRVLRGLDSALALSSRGRVRPPPLTKLEDAWGGGEQEKSLVKSRFMDLDLRVG
jgi:hypothetical protein